MSDKTTLYKFADVLLTAFQVGIVREEILSTVTKMEADGATPEQITKAIASMRDKAIEDLRNTVSHMPD